jgi:hemolysin activation/secretion protein
MLLAVFTLFYRLFSHFLTLLVSTDDFSASLAQLRQLQQQQQQHQQQQQQQALETESQKQPVAALHSASAFAPHSLKTGTPSMRP